MNAIMMTNSGKIQHITSKTILKQLKTAMMLAVEEQLGL